jgi:hypothetical protein
VDTIIEALTLRLADLQFQAWVRLASRLAAAVKHSSKYSNTALLRPRQTVQEVRTPRDGVCLGAYYACGWGSTLLLCACSLALLCQLVRL